MTVKLQIEVTSPLTSDDHEMLAGMSVMVLAIANRHLAEERFPDAFTKTDDGEATEEEPVESLVEPTPPEEKLVN